MDITIGPVFTLVARYNCKRDDISSRNNILLQSIDFYYYAYDSLGSH